MKQRGRCELRVTSLNFLIVIAITAILASALTVLVINVGLPIVGLAAEKYQVGGYTGSLATANTTEACTDDGTQLTVFNKWGRPRLLPKYYCDDVGNSIERFCSGSGVDSKKTECAVGCKDGKCVNCTATGEVYDDFSGTSLDLSKWEETAASDSGTEFVTEHDVRNGIYHTAQLTEANRAVTLIATRPFSAGEVLEYDVFYKSGSGNRLGRLYFDGGEGLPINERYLDTRLRAAGYNTNGYATSGNIGYWNGDSEVGNMFGTYHVRVEFIATGAKIVITNPTGALYPFGISLPLPARFGVSTKTGHNGIVTFDYDNFVVK